MGSFYWQQAVSIGLYGLMGFGWYLVFGEIVRSYYRRRQRSRLLESKKASLWKGPFFHHLTMVVETASGGKITLKGFVIIEGFLAFVLFLTTFSTAGAGAVFLSAAGVVFLFGIFRLRLESMRYRGSNEAEDLVSCILHHYRSSHCNILEALDLTVKGNEPGIKITKKALFRLLMSLRGAKSKEELKSAVEAFAFGIRTNWSSMLSQCIFAAAGEGINITLPLEDIIQQLKAARSLAEERKRLNAESTRLIRYLIPLAYGLSLVVSVKYLGLSPGDLIRNQFFTQAGLWMFLLILALGLINFMLVEMTKAGKFDY